MTVAYVDSSSLVAVEFAETGGAAVVAVLDSFDRLVASGLLEAEVGAACAREGRPIAARTLAELTWLFPDRALRDELRRVFEAGVLKGADAWHLACALYADPKASELTFVTLDEKQAAVARRLGFKVLPTSRPVRKR